MAVAEQWNTVKTQFLAYVIVSTILATFFLLYFNRVIAFLVSYVIRVYSWRRYHIYIDIQALQISLLGGRIFFTGLRYHGSNETILIQNGHITWSYWLWRVRDVSLGVDKGCGKIPGHDAESQADQGDKSAKLPCRINIVASGLEWFVYNRSPVYESVLAGMTDDGSSSASDAGKSGLVASENSQPRQRLQKTSQRIEEQLKKLDSRVSAGKTTPEKAEFDLQSGQPKPSRPTSPYSDDDVAQSGESQMPLMLQLLPIHFRCDRGAMVMGNENTKGILLVKMKTISGEIDASGCQLPDPYRQIFKIQLGHPIIEMRDNKDYKEDQLARALRDKHASSTTPKQSRSIFRRQRRRIMGQLRDLVPHWRKSVESFSMQSEIGVTVVDSRVPGSSQWQGLSRYLNEDDVDDKLRWSTVEYGAESTLLESPEVVLTIFWDVPGKVTRASSSHPPDEALRNDINGSAPPTWAINLLVKGGVINYGPWADRHRAELQRVFNPTLNKDAIPADKLSPESDRVPTRFNFYLETDEEVTLRIPTREDSKNWKWKQHVNQMRQHRQQERRRGKSRDEELTTTAASQRPYGWMDIKVAPNATVSYSMDMVAGATGFSNTLKVDLPSTEVSTSVNHSPFWRSGQQQISCDMSTPLKWNALRTWKFNIHGDKLELFLLRDHIFLLTDLIDDWASGPAQDYLLFVPFNYLLSFKFPDLKLHLNVNDVNIVNSPTDLEENTYLVLSSPCLEADTTIALDKFRPSKSAVPFNIHTGSLALALHVPPWNTQATFLACKQIASIGNLVLDGKYHYNSTTSPASTDTLVLDVSGESLAVNLYGFFIRYFLQLKDNYLGDHVHFQTLEEYQEMLRLKSNNPGSEDLSKSPTKKSSDMDVMLGIHINNPKLVLPANLYSAKRSITVEAAVLGVDMRFTNYYMDLDLALSPLSLSLGSEDDSASTPTSGTSNTQMFVDSVAIYGHRLFGLPPTEPTYMCNWDLSIGSVTGECSVEFLTTLISGGKAFGFSLDDDENALIPYSSIVVYDVTFLRVIIQSIQIWLHMDEAAFLFSTDAVDVTYNDWARTHYSKRADILIPKLEVACINVETASRHRTRLHGGVETDAFLRTSVNFALIARKPNFDKERKIQQDLIGREDQRTHRAEFLLVPNIASMQAIPVDVPAQSVPPVPQPNITDDDIEEERRSISTTKSSRRRRLARNQSSFLSNSNDSIGSVLHPGSIKPSRPPPDRVQNRSHPGYRPSQEVRSATHRRDFSNSTGRHSAFYTARGDLGEKKELLHNTVAFSSQYFPPYFPLDHVRPDPKDAALCSIESVDGGVPEIPQFRLDDIDAGLLDQELAHQSYLLEFPAGVTAFLNAKSLRHIVSLMSALQPTDPSDILDILQTGAMSEIFDEQKRMKFPGSIKEFALNVPEVHLRLLHHGSLDVGSRIHEEQDQYDFTLTKFALSTRIETYHREQHPEGPRSTLTSLHCRLHGAEASAAERKHDASEAQAAIKINIDDVGFSFGSRAVKCVNSDIGNFRISSSSGKVQYLANLIHRTSRLATEVNSLFTDASSRGENRPKLFVYRLMTEGQKIGDPSFITRSSAVLRAATAHLRTYDSWKLSSRLRQVWGTLSEDVKEHITLECLGREIQCPESARSKVADLYQSWRGWDLDNIDDSTLMKQLFGKNEEFQQDVAESQVLVLVSHFRRVEFLLDPGPRQSQISATESTIRLQTNIDEPGQSRSTSSRPATTINIHCSHAGINIKWELLDLANDILPLYQQTLSTGSADHSKQQSPREKAEEKPMSFHLVFSLNRGSICVETVNLKSDTESQDLKLSVTLNKTPSSTDLNGIIACDLLATKLKSHHQEVVMIRLKEASLFAAYTLQMEDDIASHTIKAAANSQNMIWSVKQDPLVLSEVLDTIVRDEIAQLYQLRGQLPVVPQSSKPKTNNVPEQTSAISLQVAFFLNNYTISLPLLQSLAYTISGVVARAAMAATLGREILFDFDIKENSHDIQIKVNNVPRSISLLQIPPTNGRITSHVGSAEHSLTIFASVELVQLDASAVYSLLTALNRPEMSNAINDLQQQIKMIQEHFQDIVGPPQVVEPEPAGSNSAKLVYMAHATLAGIEIFGQSPIRSETAPLAHLSFCLNSIHMETANRLDPQGPILERPEVYINFNQVLIDIQKGSPGAMQTCGNLCFGAFANASTVQGEDGKDRRSFSFNSDAFEINLSAETVSTIVDVLGYMGDKIKDLDTAREVEYLQKRLRQSRPRIVINDEEGDDTDSSMFDSFFESLVYTFEIRNIQVSWLVTPGMKPVHGMEDLVLSLQRIEIATKENNTARLTIEDLQLQMVPPGRDKIQRSSNSALLPEVIFNVAYVSTVDSRRMAFQAVGKSLDLQLTSNFIVPAANLSDSIGLSIKNAQQASRNWTPIVVEKATEPTRKPQRSMFGSKRLESLLIDADFAGAVVNLSGRKLVDDAEAYSPRSNRPALAGKYGQFSTDDSRGTTVLQSPGLAWKTEYRDDGKEDPAIYGEIKVDASRNILYPALVPLIMDISSSIKEVVRNPDNAAIVSSHVPTDGATVSQKSKSAEDENIITADPSVVLGRMKLNMGLRIRKQEFTLSCQPIARVAATSSFEDVYITVNTVHSPEYGNFFSISGTFNKIQTSVQHVYSRDSTGSFEVDSIVLSLMNSKHVSGTSGVSAILKVSPMKVAVNAKQLQDFLLFREIWVPPEVRQGSAAPVANPPFSPAAQGHLVQRYQQVAATAAFPWTATISISALDVSVDLGQSLGKSVFAISDFWVSSKKTSDWEQNLCLGFKSIGIECVGRLSGSVGLQDFKLRTSIEWPDREAALNETPRVQASVGFSQLRLKAAFDYQAFLAADITSIQFLMYNVRQRRDGSGDRLVAIFDGDAVQVFGTTTSAAQGVALWQALQRLIQERRANFESSLRDIEKYMKRKSLTSPGLAPENILAKAEPAVPKSPISLDTDVVVTLKALNLGVFPNTFSDHQVFKLEAFNAQARFGANMEQHHQQPRIHSILGLTLGQLRIGLAGVQHRPADAASSRTSTDIDVDEVIASVTGARGGTILKVPKVEAVMQTWQQPESRTIDYIFKSAFEGKVEVGWNYSRISYIRGMWAAHSKAFAAVWGRELPEMSAIRVTGVPEAAASSTESVVDDNHPTPGAAAEKDVIRAASEAGKDGDAKTQQQEEKHKQTKITAEVNVPLSKYEYIALEPPVIETPQLRDMGEATPPLEWIGLHRDRLPNLTHQIVIVSLLELAGEVEDAYSRILGSS